MARKFKNNASSTLAGELSIVATTLTVAVGHGDKFPVVALGVDDFMITLQTATTTEIVRVTARALGSDSMTIVRAQEGTAAITFIIGDIVSHRLTAASLDSFLTSAPPADSIQALVDATTITWDITAGNVGTVTLAGDRTIALPTNLHLGSMILVITQDGTGSRLLTWNSVFKWSGGAAPVLSTTAGAKDILSFFCDGSLMYGSLVSRGAV